MASSVWPMSLLALVLVGGAYSQTANSSMTISPPQSAELMGGACGPNARFSLTSSLPQPAELMAGPCGRNARYCSLVNILLLPVLAVVSGAFGHNGYYSASSMLLLAPVAFVDITRVAGLTIINDAIQVIDRNLSSELEINVEWADENVFEVVAWLTDGADFVEPFNATSVGDTATNFIFNMSQSGIEPGRYLVDVTSFSSTHGNLSVTSEPIFIQHPINPILSTNFRITPASRVVAQGSRLNFGVDFLANFSANFICAWTRDGVEEIAFKEMGAPQDFPEEQELSFDIVTDHAIGFKCLSAAPGPAVQISSSISVQNWDMKDFRLIYPPYVVMQNVPNTFPLTLELGTFLDPLPHVTASVEYGDATPTYNYSLASFTFSHRYPFSGIYNGNVRLNHPQKGSIDLTFTARVGYCQTSVSTLRGLMGSTQYSFTLNCLGSDVNATLVLDWNDGTSDSHNYYTTIFYSHTYMNSGQFYPKFTFRSKKASVDEYGSFIQDPVQVEGDLTDGSLKLSLDKTTVKVPTGEVLATVTLERDKDPLLDMQCTLHFQEDLDPKPRLWQGNLSPRAFFSERFTYFTLGSHDVTANCSNGYSQVLVSAYTFVYNPCFSNDSVFDEQYRFQNPLTVQDSQEVRLVSRNVIPCPKPKFWWYVEEVTPEGSLKRTLTLAKQPNADFLVLRPGWLDPGLYVMKLNISLGPENGNTWLLGGMYVKVMKSPLVAQIEGGSFRTTDNPRSIVDGYSLSYDPVLGLDVKSGLQFIWSCVTYNTTSLEELIGSASGPFADNLTADCDDISDEIKPGFRQLSISNNVTAAGYLFKLTVKKGTTLSKPVQVYLQYSRTSITIGLKCLVNCETKTAVTSHVLLSVTCEECSNADLMQSSYVWSLFLYENTTGHYRLLHSDSYFLPSGTDTGPMVSIKEKSLQPCVKYRVTLRMTTSAGYVSSAGREMFTNCPPWGGNCTVHPTFGDAVNTTFIFSCHGWRDDGFVVGDDLDDDAGTSGGETAEDVYSKLLFYRFLLRKNGITVPIAESAQSVMPRVEIPLIPGQGGGYYDLLVRIYDVLEDYTEIAQTIYLDESNLDEEASVNGTKVIFWQGQVAYSGHGSTVDKQLRAIATASGLLTFHPIPEYRHPLEVAMANESEAVVVDKDWYEMWQDLKEPITNPTLNALTEITSTFSKDVQQRGTDCSQLTGQGVAALGEGMAAALHNPETVDNSTAVVASEVAELGSKSLTKLFHRKPFPVSARLDDAVFSMTGLIDRILEAIVPTYDLSVGNELLFNITDMGPDDSKLIVSKVHMVKAYKERRKMDTGRRTVPNVRRAVTAMLDTLLKGVVLGQGPRHVRRNRVSLSVCKLTGRRLSKTTLRPPGVDLQLNLADQEDEGSGTDPDEALDIRASVYDKNPLSWANDGSSYEVTSPVVTVEAKDSQGRNKTLSKITLAIRRNTTNHPAPVVHTFSSNDSQDGPDGFLYHRMTLRSGSSAVVTRFRLPENFTTVTAFFRTGRPPTVRWHDYRTAGEPVSSRRRRRSALGGGTSSGGVHQFFVPPGSLSPGIVFIGFQLPELDANVSVDYGFSGFSDMCRVWNEDSETWDGTSCTVSPMSSPDETVCICSNPPGMSFATSFFVAPNNIDFDTVFLKFDPNNAAVYGTLIGLCFLWFLAMLWARPRDKRDRQRWTVRYLTDNYVMDSHYYMLTVYTGLRKGAGTKSNVQFIVAGANGQSRVRLLSDGERELTRGSVLTYIMTSQRDLGRLRCIRLWQDDSALGDLSSWYLSRVVIEDLHKGEMYNFICERWFAVDKDDGHVDRIVPATRQDEELGFHKLFNERARLELTESHIWISCLLRPERSSFTRKQRVTCCLALLLLTMISSAMFFQPENQETGQSNNKLGMEVSVGPLRFSLTSVWTSLVSVCISTLPTFLFVVLFRSYRPRPGPRVTVADGRAANNMKNNKKHEVEKGHHPGGATEKSKEVNKAGQIYTISAKIEENSGEKTDTAHDTESGSNQRAEDVARNLCDVLHSVLQQNPLPHWSVYLTWLALLVTMATCAFFLLLYSMQWGPTTSQEWLGAFFLSFFQSIFLIDPIKVLLLSCLLAYCAPNPLNATQYQHVDMHRVKKEVQTLATHCVDPEAQPPQPISEKLLRASRKRHQQEKLAQSVFAELILYLIFVFCIFSISYGSRDTSTFWTNAHVNNLLYSASGNAPFPFERVATRKDVIRYLNETVQTSVFPWTNMVGEELPWQQRQFASDGVSFRVGPVRVRQVRLPSGSSPEVTRMYPTLRSSEEIHPEYSTDLEDRGSYCLGWRRPPCSEEEATFKYSTAAWKYTDDVTPISIWGIHHFYGSGGYVADLSVNRDVVMKVIDELHQEQWLDLHTRAVFVEACLYNPNTNLFTFLRLGVEFPETGAGVTWRELQTLRLYQHLGATGVFLFMCELLALIFVFVFTVRIVRKLKEQKCSFFKDVWQILDLLALLWLFIALVFYVTKALSVNELMSKWRSDPKAYVDFYTTVIWDTVYGYILAALVFAVTIRLLRVLGYNQRVTMLATVLRRSSGDLLGYSFMFFIVISAYATAGLVLFRTELVQFRSVLDTYSWLYIVLLGRNRLGNWIRNAPLWAQAYYMSLTVLVLFILYTMFEAILCSATSMVKSQVDSIPPPYGLTNVIAQFYRTITDLLPVGLLQGKVAASDSKKPPTNGVTSGKDGDESSTKVDEIAEAKKLKKAMAALSCPAPKKSTTYHRPDDKPYMFELDCPPSNVAEACGAGSGDSGEKTPPMTVSAFIADELMGEMANVRAVMQELLKREGDERKRKEMQGVALYRV